MESPASTTPARIVRDTLLEYAERGVFRGFEHRPSPEPGTDARNTPPSDAGGVSATFRFFWLGPHPFHIDLGADGGTLTIRDPLPGLHGHPAVRSDVERIIAERLDPAEEALPPHRRIDPEKVSVELVPAVSPRGEETADLVLEVREGHHEYAVRKALNLIHEIWVRLQDRHQRYLWEEFQAPME